MNYGDVILSTPPTSNHTLPLPPSFPAKVASINIDTEAGQQTTKAAKDLKMKPNIRS